MYSIPETLWALALVKSKGFFCVGGLPGHRLLTIAVVGTPTKQGHRDQTFLSLVLQWGSIVLRVPTPGQPERQYHGTRDVLRTSAKCLGTFCSKQAQILHTPASMAKQGIPWDWLEKTDFLKWFCFSFLFVNEIMYSLVKATLLSILPETPSCAEAHQGLKDACTNPN